MRARRATFLQSATSPALFPAASLPEVAFAGRSNVGKSSLLNALVGVPKLARTSSTPGRTRLLNWFHVEPPSGGPLHFVDLPGYGFAKVSVGERASWRPLIEAYIQDRSVLRLVVVIVDARRGAEQEERDLLEWLGFVGRRAVVVLTKSDKLPRSHRLPAAAAARRELALSRDPIVFSAESGDGVDPLWRAIELAVKS